MRTPFKTLVIPDGKKESAEGEKYGDNWLVADCGKSDGHTWMVTTDRIHASEYGLLMEDVDFSPKRCGDILAEAGAVQHLALKQGDKYPDGAAFFGYDDSTNCTHVGERVKSAKECAEILVAALNSEWVRKA